MASSERTNIWRKTSRSEWPSASCTSRSRSGESCACVSGRSAAATSISVTPAAIEPAAGSKPRVAREKADPECPAHRPEEHRRSRGRAAAAPRDDVLDAEDVAERRRAHPQANHERARPRHERARPCGRILGPQCHEQHPRGDQDRPDDRRPAEPEPHHDLGRDRHADRPRQEERRDDPARRGRRPPPHPLDEEGM